MKASRIQLGKIALVLALLAVYLPARADMHADMVKFDQVYIPALSLSNQAKPQTKAAMDRLLDTWDWFKQRYAYNRPSDGQWNFDMTQIEKQLLEAQRLIEREEYAEAHEALEPVRMIQLRMRERIGMAYFIDALTRFHDPMEVIALKAKAAADKGLNDADIDRLKQAYAQAREKWDAVMDWNFNPYDYDLDNAQGEKLRQKLKAEDAALRRLEKALAGGDRKAILLAAAAIKPPFVKCYLSFGHFPKG